MVIVETTHQLLSACGTSVSPLSLCHRLCCYCDTVSPLPSAPCCAPDLPLISEMLRTTPCPDCSHSPLWIGFQCSQSEPSTHSVLPPQPCRGLPRSPPRPLYRLGLRILHCWWGLRDSRGCSCPRNRTQSWDWSAGREMACLERRSWCMGPRRVPEQTPQTSHPGLQHLESAVVQQK